MYFRRRRAMLVVRIGYQNRAMAVPNSRDGRAKEGNLGRTRQIEGGRTEGEMARWLAGWSLGAE
jgi:hypothetical protein